MSVTRYFGIDLGTSTCSVSYAVNSTRPNFIPQPSVIEFRINTQLGTKSDAVPSVVVQSGRTEQDTPVLLHGFAAEEAMEKGHVSGRNCHTIFRSVKSHLGTGRSYVRADKSLNTPIKVWSALIRQLCEMTVAEKGADFDPRKHPAVLTVPASFGSAQRDDTLEAAKLAGFDVEIPGQVQLIDEPVAALIDALNSPEMDVQIDLTDWKNVLVFDFGGGTCDLVALEVRYDATKAGGLEVVPLSISPYQQIGGDTIDLAIMDKVVWPQVCQQNKLVRENLTANERKQIEDALRYQVCRRLKILVNEELQKLSEEEIQGKDWEGISATVSLAGKCRINDKELVGVAELTAEALHQVMQPFLKLDTEAEAFQICESADCFPFATLIEQTLERAGMTSSDLDLVVLHGGSCHSPLIPNLFAAMRTDGILKDEAKVFRTPDLTTSVSRGAALYGCLSAKHGTAYIPPIVPEDLSILTEGGTYEVLASAGTQLPYTKTFSGSKQFYLSDSGQREIVVPIYIGYEDRRRRASVMTIRLAQARLPKSHPIEVELTIDTDKISRWRFRPAGHDWCVAEHVANPWIGKQATEEIERLQANRDAIRATLVKGARPTTQILIDEGLYAAIAGYTEEGLNLIEDVIHENPNSAAAWNIKGVIHLFFRDEPELSVECYKRACDFNPENMAFKGVYGYALHRVDRHAEAIIVMREALSKCPSLTYLHDDLADAFQAMGNYEEMQKELERYHMHVQLQTVRHPDDVDVWRHYERIAIRLGKYDEAEQARETILELSKDRNLLAGPNHG